MNADLIKSIPDPKIRLELLAKNLKSNFFTEPTIRYFFEDNEIEKLTEKGILIKIEGYLFNKKVSWYE
jgi:hypothetical protein